MSNSLLPIMKHLRFTLYKNLQSFKLIVPQRVPKADLVNHQPVVSRISPTAQLILIGVLLPSYSSVMANETVNQCIPALIQPATTLPPQPKEGEPLQQQLEADQLTQPDSDTYLLQGDAIFKQPGMVVRSDKASYNRANEDAEFVGNVQIHQQDILVNADDAKLNDADGQATLTQTQYQLLPSRVYGHATQVTVFKANHDVQLTSASLTACPQQENRSLPWLLSFQELNVDQQAQRVIGKHSSLKIKNIPVFYTPYFSYPMNDRASGFLFPATGTSKSLATDKPISYVKVPYYIDIAPNIDNTISLIPMSQRGLVLDNEFRYLARHHRIEHQADITLSGLQDDLAAKEGLISADSTGNLSIGEQRLERWRAHINAKQRWGRGLRSEFVWHEVSDPHFYNDIPVDTRYKGVTQTPRYARVDYSNDYLQAYAQHWGNLRLHNAPINYEKTPEIGFISQKQWQNFRIALQGSHTEFRVPVENHQRVEAKRLYLQPSIQYQVRRSYGHVTTQLKSHSTHYQMIENGYNNTGKAEHNNSIPQFALRSGLIFERNLALGELPFTQTLEPEVQYLTTPYSAQSDQPVFDSGALSVDFSNLFNLNRFSGYDRVGDTEQLTTALTSRLLDANGQQMLEVGIGQIHYLADRKTTLSDDSLQTARASDIFIKLGLDLAHWHAGSTVQLDKDNAHLKSANSRLKYQPHTDQALLINHILTNPSTPSEKEVVSVGGYSRISNEWQIGAYSNYDMTADFMHRYTVGLRYDSCCWATEILLERTFLTNDLYNEDIQLQFELKGLSSSQQSFKRYLADKLSF